VTKRLTNAGKTPVLCTLERRRQRLAVNSFLETQIGITLSPPMAKLVSRVVCSLSGVQTWKEKTRCRPPRGSLLAQERFVVK
jgi:hypothetical protein